MNFLYCTKQKDCFEISKKLKLITDFSSIGEVLTSEILMSQTPQLKLERFQNLIITHMLKEIYIVQNSIIFFK